MFTIHTHWPRRHPGPWPRLTLPPVARAARSRSACAGLLAGCLIAWPAASQAAVVESADVGGFRTFQDTGTGRIWADLDARFLTQPVNAAPQAAFASFGAYKTALESAGFTWASTADVQQLLGGLPLPSNASAASVAAGYVAIMSTVWGAEFGAFWGVAENTNAPTGQRRHGLQGSNTQPFWATQASNLDFGLADPTNTTGLWAYTTATAGPPAPGNDVPEPSGWALVSLALLGMAWGRRRGHTEGR